MYFGPGRTFQFFDFHIRNFFYRLELKLNFEAGFIYLDDW
jgi:hypothetical protein